MMKKESKEKMNVAATNVIFAAVQGVMFIFSLIFIFLSLQNDFSIF